MSAIVGVVLCLFLAVTPMVVPPMAFVLATVSCLVGVVRFRVCVFILNSKGGKDLEELTTSAKQQLVLSYNLNTVEGHCVCTGM